MRAPRYAFPWDCSAGTSVPDAGPTTLNQVSTKPGQVRGAYPRALAAKEEAGRSEESNSMSGFLE